MIARAASVGPTAMPELRAAIHEYVRGLKASGHQPEQVLVAVKALVAEARVGKRRSSGDTLSGELMDRVVAWSIAAYYASDADAS